MDSFFLENPDLTDNINANDFKQEFEGLNRNFNVVQFELQPVSAPLSDFFFDRLEEQLEDKYDIILPERPSDKPDNFKMTFWILLIKLKKMTLKWV